MPTVHTKPMLGALFLLSCLILTTGGWVPGEVNISLHSFRDEETKTAKD